MDSSQNSNPRGFKAIIKKQKQKGRNKAIAAAAKLRIEDIRKRKAAKLHIEDIRKRKFSIGEKHPNPLTEDLHNAVTNLSSELYTKDVHFLMELIQVSLSLSLSPCVCCLKLFVLCYKSCYILLIICLGVGCVRMQKTTST